MLHVISKYIRNNLQQQGKRLVKDTQNSSGVMWVLITPVTFRFTRNNRIPDEISMFKYISFRQ